MTGCLVCGLPNTERYCASCQEIRALVRASDPTDMLMVVDGSFQHGDDRRKPAPGGAGLVLARASDEVVIAVCSAEFLAWTPSGAERQAIYRAARLAPGVTIWSDCQGEILKAQRLGYLVHFLAPELRDPLHNLAHRLADVARRKDYARADRLWIPGEIR